MLDPASRDVIGRAQLDILRAGDAIAARPRDVVDRGEAGGDLAPELVLGTGARFAALLAPDLAELNLELDAGPPQRLLGKPRRVGARDSTAPRARVVDLRPNG